MNGPVLFFDGVCNLCQGAVQFVIRHDKSGKIRFASLQSKSGAEARKAVQAQYGRVPDSLILLENGHYFIESDAALRTARYFDGGWKLLSGFRIVPHFIRDAVYRLVARKRYNWFGRKEECWLPTPELKSRFLAD